MCIRDSPPPLYKPFIKEEGIIADNIAKTNFTERSSIILSLKGSMQRDKLNEWEASGDIALENIAYNDVPLTRARSTFRISPSSTSFSNLAATFGYATYIPSPYAQNQPSEGTVVAKKIEYSPKKKIVSITELKGLSLIHI